MSDDAWNDKPGADDPTKLKALIAELNARMSEMEATITEGRFRLGRTGRRLSEDTERIHNIEKVHRAFFDDLSESWSDGCRAWDRSWRERAQRGEAENAGGEQWRRAILAIIANLVYTGKEEDALAWLWYVQSCRMTT